MTDETEAGNKPQILLDPELKIMKCYVVPLENKDAFLDFCKEGLPGTVGGGVLAWLRDKGVKRADFWICEPGEESDQGTENSGEEKAGEKKSVVFLAAVDKYGLKGPDWSAIPGIDQFLDGEYPFLTVEPRPDLRIATDEPGTFLVSAWEQLRAFFSRFGRAV